MHCEEWDRAYASCELTWSVEPHFTAGTGGPRPPEVLYSVDDLVGAIPGLQVVRAERVRQAGSSEALDTLLTAHRPRTG